jgi:hypothetical protein
MKGKMPIERRKRTPAARPSWLENLSDPAFTITTAADLLDLGRAQSARRGARRLKRGVRSQ